LIAVISKTIGDVWAWLVVALVTLLCWRQPNSRSALALSGFLTLCIVSLLLFTRSFSETGFDRPHLQFVAGSLCLGLASVCWWWFCQGFPQQFLGQQLPENIEMPWILRMHGKVPTTVDNWARRLAYVAIFQALWILHVLHGEVQPSRFYPVGVVLAWGGNTLRRNYALSGAGDRRKILWIIEGSFLVVVFFIVGHIAGFAFRISQEPASFEVWVLLGISTGRLVFVACIFVGIFKDGAFDSALIIKKTVSLSILTGFILFAYLLLVGGLGNVLVRFTAIEDQSVIIFSTLAIAAAFMPIKNRVQALVDRRLFRKKYEYPQVVASIKRDLGRSASETNLQNTALSIQRALDNESVVIFALSQQDHTMTAVASAGPGVNAQQASLGRHSRLETLAEPLAVEKCELSDQERTRLAAVGSTLLIPARTNNQTVAIVSVGKKLSGKEYDAEDSEFMTSAAQELASGIVQQRLEKERQDLEQARDIQRALLPREIPSFQGLAISGAWLPARSVSGDYYDVLELSEDRVGLCIADVVGKGMPAALLMANMQAAVRSMAKEAESPADLCRKVNAVLCGNLPEGRFITFFYAVIEARTKRLVYTCGGHNPPILIRNDGTTMRLDTGGAVLGLFPNWHYETAEIALRDHDRLALFTDGVSEASSPLGEEFGEERVAAILRSPSEFSAEQIQERIIASVSEFSAGNFHDDVTVLVVQISV
jgi:serine phosphatase RsbU (regulator of sigma subunit)